MVARPATPGEEGSPKSVLPAWRWQTPYPEILAVSSRGSSDFEHHTPFAPARRSLYWLAAPLTALALSACQDKQEGMPAMPPPEVTVVTVKPADVPLPLGMSARLPVRVRWRCARG